ncbi:hypothetical protein H0H93_006868 [Arthromyces matolae]|nr:hypothetical protein H0H93_006868 [Arthromyces matolae]
MRLLTCILGGQDLDRPPSSHSKLSKSNSTGHNDHPPISEGDTFKLIPAQSPTGNEIATTIRHNINAAINGAQVPYSEAVQSLKRFLELVSQAFTEFPIQFLEHNRGAFRWVWEGVNLAVALMCKEVDVELQNCASALWNQVQEIRANGYVAPDHTSLEKNNLMVKLAADVQAQHATLIHGLPNLMAGATRVQLWIKELIEAERGQIQGENPIDYNQSLLRPLEHYGRRVPELLVAYYVGVNKPEHVALLKHPNGFNGYIDRVVNGEPENR